MMRRVLVLMTLMMIFATVAEAQRPVRRPVQRSERWDFSIQTRYTWGADYEGNDGSKLSVKEDLGWGFGFGYNFNQHFNLGMLFTWRSVPYDATAVSADDPSDTETFAGSMTTSVFGINGEYNILKGKITPYVNGSFGWMHINSNIFAGYAQGCWWYPYWGYVCGPVATTYGANETVYTLGGGIRYEINDSVYLRGGYEKGFISGSSYDGSDMLRIDIGFMF